MHRTRDASHWFIALLLLAGGIVAAVVSVKASPGFLSKDAAQYIAVARTIRAGQGVANDLIYYDSQYATGRLPAPETVFPPGLPVVIAAFGSMGIDAPDAIVAANALGLAAIPVLLCLLLVRLGLAAGVAFLLAGFHLGLVATWSYAMQGRSEPLFATFALAYVVACILSQSDGRSHGKMMILAAALGSATVMMRYQGVFVVAAIGLVFGVRCLASTSWRRFNDAILLAGIPTVVACAFFLRNQYLTGNWTGGPLNDVAFAGSPTQIAFSTYWEISQLAGISIRGLREFQLIEWGVVLAALLLGTWIIRYSRWQPSAKPEARWLAPQGLALACSAAVVFTTILALVWLGVTKSADYIQARFLSTLVPFVLIIAGVVWSMLDWQESRRRGATIALGLLLGLLLSAQVRVAGTEREVLDYRQSLYNALANALDRSVDANATIADLLRDAADSGQHVFTTESLTTGLILDRATLGPPPARFSIINYDEVTVACVAKRYNVGYLLIYPTLFDTAAEPNQRQPLFEDLQAGNVPRWLDPVVHHPDAGLFAVNVGLAPCPSFSHGMR